MKLLSLKRSLCVLLAIYLQLAAAVSLAAPTCMVASQQGPDGGAELTPGMLELSPTAGIFVYTFLNNALKAKNFSTGATLDLTSPAASVVTKRLAQFVYSGKVHIVFSEWLPGTTPFSYTIMLKLLVSNSLDLANGFAITTIETDAGNVTYRPQYFEATFDQASVAILATKQSSGMIKIVTAPLSSPSTVIELHREQFAPGQSASFSRLRVLDNSFMFWTRHEGSTYKIQTKSTQAGPLVPAIDLTNPSDKMELIGTTQAGTAFPEASLIISQGNNLLFAWMLPSLRRVQLIEQASSPVSRLFLGKTSSTLNTKWYVIVGNRLATLEKAPSLTTAYPSAPISTPFSPYYATMGVDGSFIYRQLIDPFLPNVPLAHDVLKCN